MSQTRRDFLWTVGAAAGAFTLQGVPDVFWTPPEQPDVGWTPGIEERLTSTCLLCPARCGIRGRVVDGRLVRIMGNPLHPTSLGGVCPRGVAGPQVLYHPKRLSSPLVRGGPRGSGNWTQVSRAEAIDIITQRLARLREGGHPESLAVLAGYCAGTMEELWRQFLQAFGSPNYISDAHQDGTDVIMRLMHGISRRPGYDLGRAEVVLSFGAPLFESWWSPLQAFVAFANPQANGKPRPRVIQVDVRFSRTASRAHEWVGIRPGTHGVLALGIAYVLIRDRLLDLDAIAETVTGFEDYADSRGVEREGYRSVVLANYRTEEVSAVTGVSVERVRTLARAIAERRSVVVCGRDVLSAPNGLLAGIAVHSLNALVGSVNRPGGVLFGEDPPLAALPAPVLDERSRAGLRAPPLSGFGGAFDAGATMDRVAKNITGSDSPPLATLLLYRTNPLASSVHPDLWRAALKKVPFIVSFSPFLDETTEQADLILPDLLPYERWQDGPTPESDPFPVWSIARPLVEPNEGASHTGDALLSIAKGLGGSLAASLPYDSMEQLLQERGKGLFAVRRGMIFGGKFEREHALQMEQRGWWLSRHADFESFWGELVENGGWSDPNYDYTDPRRLSRLRNGKIDLMPDALLQALREEGKGRHLYVDVLLPDPREDGEYPLRLIPYRVSTLSSGSLSLTPWLAEQPALYPDIPWVPWIEISGESAAEFGLKDGTLVRVVSKNRSYRARLKIHPGVAPGTVCAPYGLRNPDNGEPANPLRLLDGARDPLTGLPSWFTTFVRLERA